MGPAAAYSITTPMPHNRPVKKGDSRGAARRPLRTAGRAAALVLPLLVVGFLGTVAGSVATDFVRVPRVSELATYRPDIITQITARDGSTIARYAIERRILVSRAQIPPGRPQRDRRHRGQELLPARGHRRPPDRLGPRDEPPAGWLRAGRLDAHAAARPRDLPLAPARRSRARSTRPSSPSRSSGATPRTRSSRCTPTRSTLGHGNYGVEAACRYYFGKSVGEVTLAEAALLAGIVQRPEDQSPFRNPDLARSPALDRAAPHAGRGIHHGGRSAGPPTPSRCRRLPRSPSRSSGRTSAKRSGSTSRGPTARRTSTGAGCASSPRWIPSCRPGRRKSLGWGLRQLSRRHGFQRPRNLTAEGYRSLESYVDPTLGGRARRGRPDAAGSRHGARPLRGRGPDRARDSAASERRRRVDRRHLRREAPEDRRPRHRHRRRRQGRQARALPRPGPPGAGRRGRPRKRERRGAGDGRRIRLDAVQVQPLDPGAAAGRIGLQAVRVPDGPRAGLHGGGHGLRRAALDRDRSAPAALSAPQLRREVPRDRDVATGARALLQRPDRARRRRWSASRTSSRPRTGSASGRSCRPTRPWRSAPSRSRCSS